MHATHIRKKKTLPVMHAVHIHAIHAAIHAMSSDHSMHFTGYDTTGGGVCTLTQGLEVGL